MSDNNYIKKIWKNYIIYITSIIRGIYILIFRKSFENLKWDKIKKK